MLAVSRISSTTMCLVMKFGRGEAANRNTFHEGTDHHQIALWEICQWQSYNSGSCSVTCDSEGEVMRENIILINTSVVPLVGVVCSREEEGSSHWQLSGFCLSWWMWGGRSLLGTGAEWSRWWWSCSPWTSRAPGGPWRPLPLSQSERYQAGPGDL